MIAPLLPDNATELELSLDAQARAAFDAARPVPVVWDPAACPENLLPLLAWALSVDVWSDAWSTARKRQVIAASAGVHRRKGTVGAIRRALAALDNEVTISRWFEHGGEPYTLRADVEVYDRPLTADEVALIRSTIVQAKAARSWLTALRVFLSSRGTTHAAAAPALGCDVVVGPPPLVAHAVAHAVAGAQFVQLIEVLPHE